MAKIYAPKGDDGDLVLVADAEGAGAEDAPLIIDTLLDENPRIRHRDFVIIEDDAHVTVKVESDDPVQPRRPMTVNGGPPAAQPKAAPKPKEPAKKKEAAKEQATKPASKPKAKAGSKAATKPKAKASAKPAAKKGGKSPFKSNPASAE